MTVMMEAARPETATATGGKHCVRCGGTSLVEARLEHGMTLFFNDETHHSTCNVPMRANLCQECGYAEFFVIDPARTLPCEDDERMIQEEDF